MAPHRSSTKVYGSRETRPLRRRTEAGTRGRMVPRRLHRMTAAGLLALVLGSFGCAPMRQGTASPASSSASERERGEASVALCDHRVPADVCSRHHPELEARFKKVGDWCDPHDVPESQCLLCHPDLSFRPLPDLPESADVAWLAREGEDVPDLGAVAVKGKVTVFEFYADWCAACRKVDDHVFERLAKGDTSFAYRKLNVVAWESPLGERYMKGVPSLPLLVVFDRNGRRFRALFGLDTKLLDATIAEAAR